MKRLGFGFYRHGTVVLGAGYEERIPGCDIALDTLRYNSHGTAADIFWAGVPLVITLGFLFSVYGFWGFLGGWVSGAAFRV